MKVGKDKNDMDSNLWSRQCFVASNSLTEKGYKCNQMENCKLNCKLNIEFKPSQRESLQNWNAQSKGCVTYKPHTSFKCLPWNTKQAQNADITLHYLDASKIEIRTVFSCFFLMFIFRMPITNIIALKNMLDFILFFSIRPIMSLFYAISQGMWVYIPAKQHNKIR